MPASVLYGLFCEDIRPEQRNKVSAMGMLGRSITMSGPLPGVLDTLAIHFCVYNPDHDARDFSVVMTLPSGESQVLAQSTLPAVEGFTGHNLNLFVNGVPIAHEGDIVARLEIACEPPIVQEIRLFVTGGPPPA